MVHKSIVSLILKYCIIIWWSHHNYDIEYCVFSFSLYEYISVRIYSYSWLLLWCDDWWRWVMSISWLLLILELRGLSIRGWGRSAPFIEHWCMQLVEPLRAAGWSASEVFLLLRVYNETSLELDCFSQQCAQLYCTLTDIPLLYCTVLYSSVLFLVVQ